MPGRKIALVALTALIQIGLVCSCGAESKLNEFLWTSAYGTMSGAAIGAVAMATSDNPSGNWTAVARGSSLGLYAGVLVGLALQDQTPRSSFAITPSPNGLNLCYLF